MRSSLSACLVLVMISFALVGCDSKTKEDEKAASTSNTIRKVKINLLVVGDEKLGPVIKRQFVARRNGEVNLSEITWDEFAKDEFKAASENDVVIYPGRRIGELATRDLLEPITEDNARLEENANRSLLFSDRGKAVSWGGHQLGVSLGQSQWLAIYRKDVMEATESEVPGSWKEFDELVREIESMQDESLPKQIAIPLKGHWASYSLFVRVASAVRVPGKYSTYFDVSSMKPQIDTVPFVMTLNAMQTQSRGIPVMDPEELLKKFEEGQFAVALVPVNRFWLQLEEGKELPAFQFAAIPGWSATYDSSRDSWKEQLSGAELSVPFSGATGMLASCTTSCQQKRNAIEMMLWLTNKQISGVVSVESANTGLSRLSHLGNLESWLGEHIAPENLGEFSDVMRQLNGGRRFMNVPRIPGSDRYLDLLDAAVRAVLVDDKNVVETLAKVAKEWTEVTRESDLDTLKKHYRQSEGLKQ